MPRASCTNRICTSSCGLEYGCSFYYQLKPDVLACFITDRPDCLGLRFAFDDLFTRGTLVFSWLHFTLPLADGSPHRCPCTFLVSAKDAVAYTSDLLNFESRNRPLYRCNETLVPLLNSPCTQSLRSRCTSAAKCTTSSDQASSWHFSYKE